MSTSAGGGGEDGNGDGHPKGKNTNVAPDPKKMSTLERGMLQYMQGKTTDAIARGEESPWDAFYAPLDTLCEKKNCRCHCKRRGTSIW
jgi:catalase (peroxidase I)